MDNNRWHRNNLDGSSSPYLRQHAGNPIWWQEWNNETLTYAAAAKKPLLVSVGYATCHWCHVMAREAFSDPETAGYINDRFVSIKVDREQRPDIDQYLMNFIQAQTGGGGWPLNVFLTHDQKPVHALTYAPLKTSGYRYSFLDIAKAVIEFLDRQSERIIPFTLPDQEAPVVEAERLSAILSEYYDHESGVSGRARSSHPIPHCCSCYTGWRLTARGTTR
ncbi:MAG: thioredoxin domain-containing protein [Bacteroidales bacterium]